MADTNSYVEEDNSHSLPSPEDVRTEAAIASVSRLASGPRKQRRNFVLVGACTLALTLVIGFSVGIATSSNDTKNKSSSESRDPVRFQPDGDIEPEDPANFVSRKDSRLGQVTSFLNQRVTQQADFDNKNSPQYKAALWIADQDLAYFDIPTNPLSYDGSYWFVQRYILAVMYFALDGKNWRYKSGFLSEADVCEWNFYLSAEEAPEGSDRTDWTYGVQCNDNDAVDMIFMSHNNMKGQIPSEVGDLLDLDHLSLFENNISGNFPKKLEYLTNLKFLAIESNILTGNLPNWLPRLTSLKFLALGDNNLDGELPSLAGLDDLRDIALDYNSFTGGIDKLNDCPSLVNVYLNNNNFADRFDDDTFSNLNNLEVLEAGDNMLTGNIPWWIYGNTVADLHDNFLNETGLPDVDYDDFNDSPLTFFSVYGNDIAGSIPESFTYLTNVVHMDLSDNWLTGTIPDSFNSMFWLRNLYLTENDFTWQEFPWLRDCTKLEELSLAETSLSGSIPHYVGKLENLVLLDLRDNELTGQIPNNLGDLGWLQYLLLNRNSLTGEVPDSLQYLEELVSLYLDNNNLSGSVNHVCNASPDYLVYFSADCGDNTVECNCCNICCNYGDDTCNYWEDTLRLSDKATRDQYLFSEDITFIKAGKTDRK